MSNAFDDDDDEYKVGYKKPPRHSQFRPGQSGNPGGKRRKFRPTSFERAIELALNQQITINMSGESFRSTVWGGLGAKVTAMALAGDLKALSVVLAHAPKTFAKAVDKRVATKGGGNMWYGGIPLDEDGNIVISLDLGDASKDRIDVLSEVTDDDGGGEGD